MKTMKLTTLCLLAALLVGAGSVMAQDERRDYSEQANLVWLQNRGDRPGLRPADRDRRWDGRRPHHRRGWHRGGCCGAPRHVGRCCEAYGADGRHAPDCPYYADADRPAPTKEELEKREAERKQAVEERRAARQAYEESLQKIGRAVRAHGAEAAGNWAESVPKYEMARR